MTNSTSTHDEQSILDTALADTDRLLMDSLRSDERRRRRRRLLLVVSLIGGLIMTTTVVAALAGWLTIAAVPAPARADSAIEQAENLTAEGWQFWKQQKFSDAADKFEEAVKFDPGAAGAWNGLGWARFNSGDSIAAVPAFEKCVELEPDHPAALNGLGQTYLSWRKYGTAKKYLTKAAPQASAAWYGLAKLYLLTGKYKEAVPWIEKALSQQPNDPWLPKMLAAAKEGELPDDLRQMIEPPGKPKPSDSTADSARGWQQFNQGKMRSAEANFRKALAKDPENAAALNGLGFCLLNSGKAAQAKQYFEKCIDLDSNAAGAMNGLARCLKAEGKDDEAVAIWLEMQEKFTGPTAATVGLATTYLERREYDKALPLYEQLVKATPDNAEFKQGLEAAKSRTSDANEEKSAVTGGDVTRRYNTLIEKGWLQFFTHKFAESEATFRRILVANPNDLAAMNGLGFSLLNQGNVEEAKPYFERIVAETPNSPGPMNGLARCLKQEGKLDEAIAVWERAREGSPEPNDITAELGMAYLEKGEKAKAVPLLEVMVAARPDNSRLAEALANARDEN